MIIKMKKILQYLSSWIRRNGKPQPQSSTPPPTGYVLVDQFITDIEGKPLRNTTGI